jgi:hypothetical protein
MQDNATQKHKAPCGFLLVIPVFGMPKTISGLDRAATGAGLSDYNVELYNNRFSHTSRNRRVETSAAKVKEKSDQRVKHETQCLEY